MWVATVLLALSLWGCRGLVSPPPPVASPDGPASPPPVALPESKSPGALPASPPPEDPPQLQASVALTHNGRALLSQGRVDSAIREFERAVSLNPHHGPGYYYLAESWRLKGDARQAGSFHRLAQTHLRGNPDWRERLARQNQKIQEMVRRWD